MERTFVTALLGDRTGVQLLRLLDRVSLVFFALALGIWLLPLTLDSLEWQFFECIRDWLLLAFEMSSSKDIIASKWTVRTANAFVSTMMFGAIACGLTLVCSSLIILYQAFANENFLQRVYKAPVINPSLIVVTFFGPIAFSAVYSNFWIAVMFESKTIIFSSDVIYPVFWFAAFMFGVRVAFHSPILLMCISGRVAKYLIGRS